MFCRVGANLVAALVFLLWLVCWPVRSLTHSGPGDSPLQPTPAGTAPGAPSQQPTPAGWIEPAYSDDGEQGRPAQRIYFMVCGITFNNALSLIY